MRRHSSIKRFRRVVLFCALFPAFLICSAAANDLDFNKDVKPFFEAYCAKCHNAEKAKGGINLGILNDEIALYRHRGRVHEIIEQLNTKAMPPEDAALPDDDLRQKLSAWLSWKLENFDPKQFQNPGYMPSHRLTRTQYRNTIRDLFGVGMEVADDLPTDEASFGFDQIGDVQEVSSIHLEKYLEAASYVLDRVFVPSAQTWAFDPRKLEYVPQFGVSGDDEKILFPENAPKSEVTDEEHIVFHTGGVTLSHLFPHTGLYEFKFRVWGNKADGVRRGPSVKLKLDAHRVGEFGVPTGGKQKIEEPVVRVIVRAGQHDIKLDMEGMGVSTNTTDSVIRFNHFAVQAVQIKGPIVESETKAKEVLQRILVAKPALEMAPRDAARKVLQHFATRAYRRPASHEDVDNLLTFFDRAVSRGDSYENAIKLALKVALVSPDFLFHIERDQESNGAYRISSFELANRLSYFIWGSMPDEELFKLAEDEQLHDLEVLSAQTRRMLKDPKSRALAESFAPQWLGLGSLFAVHRDGKFHENNLQERKWLLEEVVRSFDFIIREDRPVIDLLTADYVFVNKFLADHYGIPDVTGREFQKVQLTGDLAAKRGGVLGMAAVHFAVSHPKDTNPSGRGKWVLDALLGTPPPPPPPNVPQLPKEKAGEFTLRERLSQHRSDPNCAACHAKIDPIGFAMESYNSVGAWRETENGKPLDTSAEFPGGRKINGPAELRHYLATEKAALFRRNLTERMLIFALRRGLEFYDEGPVREILKSIEEGDDRIGMLVLGIVKSYPFQYRQNPQTRMAKHE